MNNAQLINQDSGVTEWHTPSNIVDAARAVMGSIYLDPASCAKANEIVQASEFFTKDEDGLRLEWFGTVWMNHPYGRKENPLWVNKLIDSYENGHVTEAICIVNASTSEQWFRPLYQYPICFVDGRVKFWLDGDENAKAGPTKGSAIIYLGPHVDQFARVFSELGNVMARSNGYRWDLQNAGGRSGTIPKGCSQRSHSSSTRQQTPVAA